MILRSAPARRRALVATAGLVLLGVGAGAWLLGPGAPWLVEQLANGRGVWRLGVLHLEDVSGSSLGDLKVKRLTIADEKGVWIEARDVELAWEPLRLLTSEAAITAASARRIDVLRRPILGPAKPPGRDIKVDLHEISVERLAFAQPVFGEAAAFKLAGGFAALGGRVDVAALDLARLDTAEDSLQLRFVRAPRLSLELHGSGAEGGFFAAALGADAPVRIDADAKGTPEQGAGSVKAKVGDRPLLDGVLTWSPERWDGRATAHLVQAPALATLHRRLGDEVKLVFGAGPEKRGLRRYDVSVVTPQLEASSNGALRGMEPEGAAQIAISTSQLAKVVPEVQGGAARFEGRMLPGRDGATIEGRLTTQKLEAAVLRGDFAGPVTVRLAPTDVRIDAQLSGPGGVTLTDPLKAPRPTEIRFAGNYDIAMRRLNVRAVRLQREGVDVSGAGDLGTGATGLRGAWRAARLDKIDPRVIGTATGRWAMTGSFGKPIAIEAGGTATRLDTAYDVVDQLLEGRARFESSWRAIPGGVELVRLKADSADLRLGAKGRIVRGDLDIAYEASARGPVSLGQARVTGVVDATGKLYGEAAAPGIVADARLDAFDVAGLMVRKPSVRFTLSPGLNRSGEVRMEGLVADAPATASAVLAGDRRGLALNQIQADFAGMAIRGQALLADAGPTLDLAFSGRTDKLVPGLGGVVSGQAQLRPGAKEPVLDLTAELKRGSYQSATFRSLRAEAHGPLDALALSVVEEGSVGGSASTLNAQGTLRREGAATLVRFEASGAVGEDTFRTKTPAVLRMQGDRTQLDADLAIGDGAASLRWSDDGVLNVEAKLQSAPIRPIAAFFGEPARGAADGTLTIYGDARSLRASYDLTLRDALFARRARDPLTITARGGLDNGRLTGALDMRSQGGLALHAEGYAPVAASGHPLRVALAGTGEATWRASGPAQTLWGVVGTLDQAVEGQLDGQGRMRFSREALSGDGGIALSGGRFADKQTGMELRDVAARLVFDTNSARLESFSARDARGGALTGSGEVTGLSRGRIALALDGLQILDRADAKARASGPLVLAWTPEGAVLDGDLRILEAEIQAPNAAAAAIPRLDVIEINRPDEVEIAEARAVQQEGEALPAFAHTKLNLKLRAPSRVFARGRGLDTEWSLNVQLTGDAHAPLLFGEARLVRGRFTLANQPFDIDRGYVRFNGAPDNALVDIAATRTSDTLTATGTLSGEINDPQITLSSTPSLPEDEILPQVLFGRSVQDLSALEAAQLAGSLAQLAGRASVDVAGIARNLVGLDRLDVRDTGSGLRIAGGKYLTRDVYLEVARTAVGETDTGVEWRLRPQLYLVSSFNPTGGSKVSVRWRREY